MRRRRGGCGGEMTAGRGICRRVDHVLINAGGELA